MRPGAQRTGEVSPVCMSLCRSSSAGSLAFEKKGNLFCEGPFSQREFADYHSDKYIAVAHCVRVERSGTNTAERNRTLHRDHTVRWTQHRIHGWRWTGPHTWMYSHFFWQAILLLVSTNFAASAQGTSTFSSPVSIDSALSAAQQTTKFEQSVVPPYILFQGVFVAF